MVRSLRGWVNRAADRHRLLVILVVAVLVSAPGYWRQEQAITQAQDAGAQGKATAAQAQHAADQAAGAASDAQDAISRAQDAIDQIVAQRTESRKSLCEKDKRFAEGHNLFIQATAAGFGGFVHNLGELSKRPDDPPAKTAAIDAEVKRQTDLFAASVNAARVAVPDCSPEGIAKSLNQGSR